MSQETGTLPDDVLPVTLKYSHENCEPEALCESESSPLLYARGLSLKKILFYASQHLQAPHSLLLGCGEQGGCTCSLERASEEENTLSWRISYPRNERQSQGHFRKRIQPK